MMALILATEVWMLIKAHLTKEGMWKVEQPPRAIEVPDVDSTRTRNNR